MAYRIALDGTSKNTLTIGINGVPLSTEPDQTRGGFSIAGRSVDQQTDPTLIPDTVRIQSGGEILTASQGALLNLKPGILPFLDLPADAQLIGGSVSSATPGDVSKGGSAELIGGYADSGGNVILVGGSGLSRGGSIALSTGVGPAYTGSILMYVGSQNALTVGQTYAWQVGPTNDAGTSGYVLTSQGPSASPIWAAAAGGVTPRQIAKYTSLRAF